jgi:hypothetical protein
MITTANVAISELLFSHGEYSELALLFKYQLLHSWLQLKSLLYFGIVRGQDSNLM